MSRHVQSHAGSVGSKVTMPVIAHRSTRSDNDGSQGEAQRSSRPPSAMAQSGEREMQARGLCMKDLLEGRP